MEEEEVVWAVKVPLGAMAATSVRSMDVPVDKAEKFPEVKEAFGRTLITLLRCSCRVVWRGAFTNLVLLCTGSKKQVPEML